MIRKWTVKACGVMTASSVLGLMFAPSLWNLLSLVSMALVVGLLMWLALKPVSKIKASKKNAPSVAAPTADLEVIDSLRALGYSRQEAVLGSKSVDAALPLEDRIRMSLLQLVKA